MLYNLNNYIEHCLFINIANYIPNAYIYIDVYVYMYIIHIYIYIYIYVCVCVCVCVCVSKESQGSKIGFSLWGNIVYH